MYKCKIWFCFKSVIPVYICKYRYYIHRYNTFKTKSYFTFIHWVNINNIFLFFIFLFYFINLYWNSSNLSIWFGHLIVFNFSLKIVNINLLILSAVMYTIISNSYFSSKEIYDYLITIINSYFWLSILFFLNSIFSTIFVIEVLSTIIFLLIITSNYSTTFYYNTLDLSKGVYSQQIFPHAYIQSLLFFFWVSLIAVPVVSFHYFCWWCFIELGFFMICIFSSNCPRCLSFW
jgi:hypothetical protein